MSLFNPSRDEVRDFFFDTWHHYKGLLPLSDLEKIGLSVILMHPEYHATLDKPAQFKHLTYFPEKGETNPFLHMSLHLSILEQISINQPSGIAEIYQQLKIKHQDEHLAQHDVLDCLAEIVWQAQRNNTGLDTTHYLQLLQQKVGYLSQ
ncbi:MAG: DUF1841 family protein [Methylophilaceae bacterium]